MSDSYADFLAKKARQDHPSGFDLDPSEINPKLFDFQRAIVRWACRRGRAAVWADCGLGKSAISLEWCRLVSLRDHRPALILTPLAVAEQFADEAMKFGIDAKVCRDGSEVSSSAVNVTNYERLHRFNCEAFGAVVLDESSVLKDFTSSTRNLLIDSFARTPYRMACTATPAPNDHVELGNHAEFLGALTRTEMLSTFFVHDGGDTQSWRLKKHARLDFWRWVCSWAVVLRSPADLGFSDDGYQLPGLRIEDVIVSAGDDAAAAMGTLFATDAITLDEQRAARLASLGSRVAASAEIVAREPDEPWIVWCDLNAESEALTKAIPGAVEVRGSDSPEDKVARLNGFRDGSVRVLVSKPSIAGHGMNWQHCARVVFVGLSHSWEQWYQAIRRTFRFGQQREVHCYMVSSELEGRVAANLRRKHADADALVSSMVAEMGDIERAEIVGMNRSMDTYYPNVSMEVPQLVENRKLSALDQVVADRWAIYRGDSVELVREIPDSSVDYSVFSPPFASLYTYSASDRDMGNCADQSEFFEHFDFLVGELLRITKPGRLLSFHCMNLPTSKERDGFIGIRDFRGELIRAFVTAGWIYHSEVVIWKDPVTAMQRTKALGLLHKQLKKDSCMSRQGIPDYLVTMRKPGVNPEPATKTNESFPVRKWQQYASPVWFDINPSKTLQYRSAREHEDERHICPLQLEVIERAVELWTNPGDVVFSPFAGIGSEGFVSVQMGRRFVGFELKESYFRQMEKNLKAAEAEQAGLFAIESEEESA